MNDFSSLGPQPLGGPHAFEVLFDRIADTVFFVKDSAGRYLSVNQTLVTRCDVRQKSDLIGKTASDVFPEPLGTSITAQDRDIAKSGKSIQAKLELHLYPGRHQGWCLTWKEPLRHEGGAITGIVGISRDLDMPTGGQSALGPVADLLGYIEDHLDSPLRLNDLAKRAGLSPYQLDNRVRALFGISTNQFVTRARIESACERLRHSQDSISRIAQDCGYGDQAAFTRQFRRSVGLTPGAYRESRKEDVRNRTGKS